MSENTITIKKDALWKYATFALLGVVIIGVIATFGNNAPSVNVGNAIQEKVAPPSGAAIQVSVDDDPFLGDENAPITIIEFSDYQCPFCERFWSETLPLIKSQYIDAGKVKFVYRDFPLSSIHPMAQPAAEAAECVRKEGGTDAYFKMHDKIFENQASLSIDNLKALAKDIGYNIGSCLDSGEFRSEVQKDFSQGQGYGVQGTPAFFINGKLISGAQPFGVFQQAIESELA